MRLRKNVIEAKTRILSWYLVGINIEICILNDQGVGEIQLYNDGKLNVFFCVKKQFQTLKTSMRNVFKMSRSSNYNYC